MNRISRREFFEGAGAGLGIAAVLPVGAPSSAADPSSAVPRTTMRVIVNGTAQRHLVEDRWTLAEALRDHLGLTGTKIGCDAVRTRTPAFGASTRLARWRCPA